MVEATFIFHGIFHGTALHRGNGRSPLARILFDVDIGDLSYSHLIADIFDDSEVNDSGYVVVCNLPFRCDEFNKAVVKYYEYAMGPQAARVAHSGPKGPSIASENVIRAQWEVSLPTTG